MPEQKGVHKLKKASAHSFSVTIPKKIVENTNGAKSKSWSSETKAVAR
ncbi:MAG: hypothetical protein PHP25_00880 [Candidatus Moranbacteria bacterium]|nr:hypothetical protein [Candidatus Moranbacteria bacterium]